MIYSVNFKPIPLLITVSIWYLVCTSVLYVGQHYLERYFGRGSSRSQGGAGRPRDRDTRRAPRRRRYPMSAPMVNAEGVHKRNNT